MGAVEGDTGLAAIKKMTDHFKILLPCIFILTNLNGRPGRYCLVDLLATNNTNYMNELKPNMDSSFLGILIH